MRRVTRQEQGFTILELVAMLAIVAIGCVVTNSILQNLSIGMKGAQDKADFIQMQSLGTSLYSSNATRFCDQAGIMNLKMPTQGEVAQYLDPTFTRKPETTSEFFSKVHFPFPAPPETSISFASAPDALLAALSSGRAPASTSGVAAVVEEFTVPFNLTVVRKMGGNVSREFPLILGIDKDRKIIQCRSIASVSGDQPAASELPEVKEFTFGRKNAAWFGSQGKMFGESTPNAGCYSTNDHAFCPSGWYQAGMDLCATAAGWRLAVLCAQPE